jgi:hypothetical protein
MRMAIGSRSQAAKSALSRFALAPVTLIETDAGPFRATELPSLDTSKTSIESRLAWCGLGCSKYRRPRPPPFGLVHAVER